MACSVSVIIPVYGVEPFLERAVDSALNQTLQDLEVILVDDGSPDRCPQICDRFAQEHPGKVRVLHQENQGLGMARNAGLALAQGEFVAFLDSDDTVEPEMYQAMLEKARAQNCDLVMCDVRIRYVEEDRETVVPCYPQEDLDLGGYIARGNNITYSVNKLFRRSLWEGVRYEKMLFEDIALIPALVTRARRAGYVPRPFYNYYRRGGTLSTTQSGPMVDIVKAFSSFLTTCDPAYKEEAVLCAAKQILWNITQARPLFEADFLTLLHRFEADFRLNPLVRQDPEAKKLLPYLDKPVIPEVFHCAHCRRPLPPAQRAALEEHFPQGRLVEPTEAWLSREGLPPSVRDAAALGRWEFVEEYFSLLALWEQGGVVLSCQGMPSLGLKRLRLERCFFGFESGEELSTLCFGALPGHYVIRALLDTYQGERIYNRAFLPLSQRLRDFLITQMGLKPNGRRQVLAGEVTVHLPSVLCYDFHDGENCCKLSLPAPQGYEVISARALELWSQRLLENWNLYKAERGKKAPQKPPPAALTPAQAEAERQKVARLYENSASWKITRPLRALSQLVRGLLSRLKPQKK